MGRFNLSIAITGSSGFVGTNFIRQVKDFQVKEVDLLTQKISEVDFSSFDAVLHLAALVHQMKGAPEEQYFKINRDLAFKVAKKAKAQGVKYFVFMSTAKVFGESTTNKPAWNEFSECKPEDAYGKSKYEAERLILGLQDENFKVAVVRSPLVYGVGVKANMYNLIKLVDKVPVLPLGKIQNLRSMVYVGNLVALLQHIIKNQSSGIFIAGDSKPLSTTELTISIKEALRKKRLIISIPKFIRKPIQTIKPVIFERLFGSLELDNSLTNKRLNFETPFSIEQGIQEMVEWYKQNK